MNRVEGMVGIQEDRAELFPPWVGRLWLPAAIASAAVTLALMGVVAASKSAWLLLGAGRGLVPEEYYHLSAFVLMLGTTFGQVVGWAGGTAVIQYGLDRLGLGAPWSRLQVGMSLAYLGLAGLHVVVFHWLVGDWLLGMPRTGLTEWLTANHPDARWLLVTAHGPLDWSLLPLGLVFLGVLWGAGDRVRDSLALQTVLALALFATSLAIALSLGIHSTLVHIRL